MNKVLEKLGRQNAHNPATNVAIDRIIARMNERADRRKAEYDKLVEDAMNSGKPLRLPTRQRYTAADFQSTDPQLDKVMADAFRLARAVRYRIPDDRVMESMEFLRQYAQSAKVQLEEFDDDRLFLNFDDKELAKSYEENVLI